MPSRYLLRRLAQALPAVAGLLALNFCIIHLAPGDPAIALGGEHGDAGLLRLPPRPLRARSSPARAAADLRHERASGRSGHVVRAWPIRVRRDRGAAPGHPPACLERAHHVECGRHRPRHPGRSPRPASRGRDDQCGRAPRLCGPIVLAGTAGLAHPCRGNRLVSGPGHDRRARPADRARLLVDVLHHLACPPPCWRPTSSPSPPGWCGPACSRRWEPTTCGPPGPRDCRRAGSCGTRSGT